MLFDSLITFQALFFYTCKICIFLSLLNPPLTITIDFAERSVAVDMGQEVINRKFGHNVKNEEVFKDDGTFYRLLEDDESTALNHGEVSNCEPLPGMTINFDIDKSYGRNCTLLYH